MEKPISDAANEGIQTQGRTLRNEWWDEEFKQHIKKKNDARTKWLQQNTRDFQMDFRPNRCTIDNIFMVRQILEKCYEFNIELHNIFVNYSQAFR